MGALKQKTPPRFLVLDYETRSEADLKKVGAWEYSLHPSTQILCVGWKLGTLEELSHVKAKVWSPAFPAPYGELVQALTDPFVKIIAHNAFFEEAITRNVLTRIVKRPGLGSIPVSRWICTASMARALALPGNLEGACLALRLPIQKDMEGRKLILKYCKPRKPTKNNPAKWHNSASDLRRIMQYCGTDIEAETLLFLRLPPLSPTERRVWELDQKINLEGFRVDRELVKTALRLIDEETRALTEETQRITDGALTSTNQRAATLDWLLSQGVSLGDLTKKTVEDALKAGVAEGAAKRLLEIRQAVSKTSTAKYLAFEMRSRSDGRVRDFLTYHTASTGRWGGAGVQPQNFPRGTIKDTNAAADDLLTGDLEWVRFLHGNPMSVLSSCLRSVIIPSEGKEFVCADYNAIEVRVLFWMAVHDLGCRMFREGQDLYRHMASEIYGKVMELINDTERFLGKSAVLGCGYGMGWKKFFETCRMQGQDVTEELAKLAVTTYRTTHAPVVEMWGNIERAAIKAVLSHRAGKPLKVKVNRTAWFVKDEFLFCELPSGRRLGYYGPTIKYEETPWGEPRPVLYHWGVNGMTRQWELSGTYGGKLTENVVQATARDLMAEAMLRAEDAGYDVKLSVHDELLAEQPLSNDGWRPLAEFEDLMAKLPDWAVGCPVKASGWTGLRYRK